ncbi:sulfatase family protein [Agaribacter marinus]|uniref:Acetylglucosamine-6-sulfatase n=1 Tax=Agaribacter marinus TaxID=1431249 RepID=A0AA37WLI0_9ALTE|nr:sulfatase [Agaribacter marinus]GLR72125.1 acetylglucosamine-6-sulfatase [Agaribacter marinus]
MKLTKQSLLSVSFIVSIVSILFACTPASDKKENKEQSDLISPSASEEVTNKPKYNILFIMTDDHAAHALGTYGGRLASVNPTPELDKLAADGLTFTNTFVTNSICTPSRASILTGQYSQANGVLDLRGSLSTEQQHLPRLMKDAGYDTAIIGKWHLKKEPGAFDYYEVLELQGKYFDPVFRVQGDNPWPQNETEYEGHSSDVVTDLTIDWLKNRSSDKPFFLMHQFKAPHDMFEYAPRYEDYLADVEIPEPTDLYELNDEFGSAATRGENDSLIRHIGTSVSQRHLRRSVGIDLGVDASLDDEAFTKAAYQKYLKAYLRCVKGVDDNVARLIATLKEQGLYDNTIIVYTSDQGMMLGEHDYIDKRWMWDESIKMPLIVRHPDMTTHGTKNDMIVNNTDFAPSLLSMAGIETPAFMHGESFEDALFGKQPENWRTASYYRYWTHRAYHDVPAHFGLRSKDYKLIFYYGENFMTEPFPYYDAKWLKETGLANNAIATPVAWELYDLKNDPNELKNVYNEERYASVVNDLKTELKRQRELYNETDKDYPHLQKIIEQHWND